MIRARRPIALDPRLGTASVTLTQGKSATVDLVDVPLIESYSWCAAQVRPGHWYAVGSNGVIRHVYMHRLLLGLPSGRWGDHRDGDGLNNRRANLRPADRIKNNRNRRAFGATSRYIGVSRKTGRTPTENPRWEVRIHLNGRGVYVGRYEDEVEAALAYDTAARARDPEFARLNFPEVVQ